MGAWARADAIAASKAAYRERNKASIAASQAAYRERNKASIAASQAAYRERNKASVDCSGCGEPFFRSRGRPPRVLLCPACKGEPKLRGAKTA